MGVLERAAAGEGWSIGALVRGLDLVVDDEGRPVNERRAPSVVKTGVPMELKACPYRDARRGSPMNISALTQVTGHLQPVLEDLERFAGRDGVAPERWRDVMVTVMDQLAAPAVHLLRARHAGAVVPAEAAVAHKLAAGFYGVIRQLVVLEAQGRAPGLDVPSVLAFTHETRALFGASEVCAGPTALIERAAQLMLHPGIGADAAPTCPVRRTVAVTLGEQIALGVAWEYFDQAIGHALLLDDVIASTLRPRNAYMAERLKERRAKIADRQPVLGAGGAHWPTLLDAGSLRAALADDVVPTPALVAVPMALFAHGDAAVFVDTPAAAQQVAVLIARWLWVRRLALQRLWQLEQRMRVALELPGGPAVEVEPSFLAGGLCAPLLEALLGHRIECAPGDQPTMLLRNHHRVVELPAAA